MFIRTILYTSSFQFGLKIKYIWEWYANIIGMKKISVLCVAQSKFVQILKTKLCKWNLRHVFGRRELKVFHQP